MVKKQDFSGSNDLWFGSYGPLTIGVNRNLCNFLQEELLCQLSSV